MSTTDKVLQIIKVVLVTTTIMIVLFFIGSSRANARPIEQEYFADLASMGIQSENEAGMIAYSKYLCEGMLNFGVKPKAALALVLDLNPTLTEDQGKGFITVSVKYYCPTYAPSSGPVVLR